MTAYLSIFDEMRATAQSRGDLVTEAARAFESLAEIDDLPTRVETINAIREKLAEYSPFQDEPVDCVRWVPAGEVEANDYNPNSVAPPEMELLRVSIMADGYTQPIVANMEDGRYIVVDGFHRNRVGRECPDVAERIQGYLPVVQVRATQLDRGDRIASTIRHNRARGKHQVDRMSDIVLELKRRNWSDDKIGRELGMDPDEVLRLAQITGLADAFLNREFSEAWEAVISPESTDDLDDAALTNPAEDEVAARAEWAEKFEGTGVTYGDWRAGGAVV